MTPIRTVALLGREPGLLVLRDALIDNPLVDLVAVYTHGRLPRAEGGGPRPELAAYQECCSKSGVPLYALDHPDTKRLDELVPAHRADLLLALSWRTILSPAVLSSVKTAINIHRGALPAYAGALPVQRAIEAGERRIAITAHHMVEEVDAGPIVGTVWLDVDPLPIGRAAADYAEEVKIRLLPLYAPLARLAIMAVAV